MISRIAGKKTVVEVASALMLLVVLAVVVSAPFLFFQQVFYLADMTYNNEPVARFIRETWQRTGHMPLWNPFVFCGVAQIQVLWPIAYMPGYIFLLLPLAPATGLFLLLHYALAGSGAYLWQYFHGAIRSPDEEDAKDVLRSGVAPTASESAQCLGYDRHGAAFLLGLTFMLSGYMTSCTVSLGLLAACAWIPWILFLIDRAIARPSVWLTGVLAFVVGQQVTSGRPELVVLSVLLYFAYLALCLRASLLRDGISRRQAIAGTLVVMFGFGLAGMFAIVDLLPMIDLVRSAPEVGSLATLGATYWKAGWYDFLTVLLSQPLGDWNMTKYYLYPTQPGTMPYVASLFLGAPVLTFAVVGFLQRKWSERWLWLACCIAGVFATTGLLSEVTSLAGRAFPDFLVFRFPIKASVFVLFALSVAASQGWKDWSSGLLKEPVMRVFRYFWLAVSIVGLVLVCAEHSELGPLLKSVGIPPGLDGYSQLPAEIVACGLSGLVVTIVCSNLMDSRVSSGSRRAVVFVVIAGLLMGNATRYLWKTVDSSFFDAKSDIAQWIKERAGQDSAEYRVLSLLPESLPAPTILTAHPEEKLDSLFMQYSRIVLKPNTNIDAGIQLSNGASTIPTWTSYFISTGLLPRSSLSAGVAHPAGKSDLPLQRWCQATSTRFVLTAMNVHDEAGSLHAVPLLDGNLFKVVNEDNVLNVRIYEVPNVLPRWSLVTHARPATDFGPALTIINRCDTTGFDPAREVVIADFDRRGSIPSLPASSSDGLPAEGKVASLSLSDNKVTLSVENPRPAYLVVADSFDPGWEARDNGTRTKVYVADGLLRAVYLEAGKHDVVFAYKPRSLFWGEIISKVTLILIGLLAATILWVRRR